MEEKTFTGKVSYGEAVDDCIEHRCIRLNPSQVIKHGVPSAGLMKPLIDISEAIVVLLKKGSGEYAVELHTDQDTKKYEAYNSSCSNPGPNSSLNEPYNSTKKIYEGLVAIVGENTFKLHVFPDLSVGIEESDIREILA
ncbi:hypothetical protein HYU07_03690 [Candidatus Woesearchaeota archaeon]|nr:hypothetical protein [Candidatus Woesearchaeota archaeon]